MTTPDMVNEVIVVRNGAEIPIGLAGARRMSAAQTAGHKIEIVSTPHIGRTLVLDGRLFLAEYAEVRRAESLIHPMMLLGPILPETVLFLGLPSRQMIRELLRYEGLSRIVIAEADEQLPCLCRELMPGCDDDLGETPKIQWEFGPLEASAKRIGARGERFDAVVWNPLGHLDWSMGSADKAAMWPVMESLMTRGGRAMGRLSGEFTLPPRRGMVEEIKTVCGIFTQALVMRLVSPGLYCESAWWLAGHTLRRPAEITDYSLDNILVSLQGDALKWVTAEWVKSQFAIPAALITTLDRTLGQLSPGHWALPQA